MVGWHHQLNAHEFESTLGTGKPGMLQFMGSQSRTQLSDETELPIHSVYVARKYRKIHEI